MFHRLAGPRTTYLLDGKKISKKELIELIGKDKVEKLTEKAWEMFMEDPYIQNDYFISKGILTIDFQ